MDCLGRGIRGVILGTTSTLGDAWAVRRQFSFIFSTIMRRASFPETLAVSFGHLVRTSFGTHSQNQAEGHLS